MKVSLNWLNRYLDKPVAAEECWAALFEPAETVREGD